MKVCVSTKECVDDVLIERQGSLFIYFNQTYYCRNDSGFDVSFKAIIDYYKGHMITPMTILRIANEIDDLLTLHIHAQNVYEPAQTKGMRPHDWIILHGTKRKIWKKLLT